MTTLDGSSSPPLSAPASAEARRCLVAALTALNVTLPAALAVTAGVTLALGLDMGGLSLVDVTLFTLAWGWILAPPLTVTSALVLGRHVAARGTLAINAAVGLLWAATVVALGLITG